jgi:tRNA pseudouridine55 synthase
MDGIIIVDKEKGWTSHDVCAFIRSRFGIKKVGHAGTLDPLATGVLIILLGRATRLFDSIAAYDKQYFGTMRLGMKTDSHDLDGKVLGEADWRGVTNEQLEQVFQMFRGEIEQEPPMISALKHKGVRLYKLARQGKTVERAKRAIVVRQLELKAVRLPEVDFFAHVSKGTYLRTLVHNIGERLGCFATLTDLRRLRCGDFGIDDAVSTAALKQVDPRSLGRFVRMASFAFAAP